MVNCLPIVAVAACVRVIVFLDVVIMRAGIFSAATDISLVRVEFILLRNVLARAFGANERRTCGDSEDTHNQHHRHK